MRVMSCAPVNRHFGRRNDRTISRTTASWHDTPGLPKDKVIANIWNGEAKHNIIVYAVRGRNYLSVSFHVRVVVENGRPRFAEAGEGHYR